MFIIVALVSHDVATVEHEINVLYYYTELSEHKLLIGSNAFTIE